MYQLVRLLRLRLWTVKSQDQVCSVLVVISDVNDYDVLLVTTTHFIRPLRVHEMRTNAKDDPV